MVRLNFERGCAICGATWGDYWEEVEGARMFFCCEVCAAQFKNLLSRIKEATGWEGIDAITVKGDFRGRVVTAESKNESQTFFVAFDPKGAVRNFFRLEQPAP